MAEIVKRIVIHNDGDFPGFSPGTAPRIELCTCKRYSDGKLASGCDTSKCPNIDHRRLDVAFRDEDDGSTTIEFVESTQCSCIQDFGYCVGGCAYRAAKRVGLTDEEIL